ncbi:MAG: polyphosphate kinase 2 family protein [Acidobacteriota bacterium]
MIEPVDSPYLVPFDGSFRRTELPTQPPSGPLARKQAKALLAEQVDQLAKLQRKLYADDRYALLLVFQAMDAAGKDGTIRAVLTGVNPAGFQVSNFKQPSAEELDHDFLWRISRRLPERGRIGVFNRSHYEEVLVVRVHPEYLGPQRLPRLMSMDQRWSERYQSIRQFEEHLARNGTKILKFWLNVSKEEQRQRFLARIDERRKNWKFSAGDVRERGFWDRYMEAYEDALNATSRPHAPWYAIPADDKRYMRLQVAKIVVESLRRLHLNYPELPADERAALAEQRRLLVEEAGG